MTERHVRVVMLRRGKVAQNPLPKTRQRYYKALGKMIAEARIGLLMTQQELADRIGLSRVSVSNIERGRQQILIHQASALADALKIKKGAFLP